MARKVITGKIVVVSVFSNIDRLFCCVGAQPRRVGSQVALRIHYHLYSCLRICHKACSLKTHSKCSKTSYAYKTALRTLEADAVAQGALFMVDLLFGQHGLCLDYALGRPRPLSTARCVHRLYGQLEYANQTSWGVQRRSKSGKPVLCLGYLVCDAAGNDANFRG